MIVTWTLAILALVGVPLFVVIAIGALWGYHQAGIDLQVFRNREAVLRCSKF